MAAQLGARELAIVARSSLARNYHENAGKGQKRWSIVARGARWLRFPGLSFDAAALGQIT